MVGSWCNRTSYVANCARRVDLRRRWSALQKERDQTKKEQLFHPDDDRHVTKVVSLDLGPYRARSVSVAQDKEAIVPPVRYAFRPPDRQWLPPDNRLLSRSRPQLWAEYSAKQLYLTALEAAFSDGRTGCYICRTGPGPAPLQRFVRRPHLSALA